MKFTMYRPPDDKNLRITLGRRWKAATVQTNEQRTEYNIKEAVIIEGTCDHVPFFTAPKPR